MKDDPLDAAFFALSHGARRRMLDLLKLEGPCNVNRVCEAFAGELGRHAVMKHLAALEHGGLVLSSRQSRERLLSVGPTPIQFIHERWTTEFSAYWASRLTALKLAAEGAELHVLKRNAHIPANRKRARHG
jgi:DNA-binding transcriptional ArsR family regulator